MWRLKGSMKHLLLIALGLYTLAPFFWYGSIAFRTVKETYKVPMPLLPHTLTLENFREVTQYVPQMWTYYKNSFVVTGGTVALVVAISALAGFAFARYRFPGRDAIFLSVMATMFIPSLMAIGPLYEVLEKVHLINTRLGLVLAYTGWNMALGTFLMRGAFVAIPRELEEAAQVDGAGPLTTFARIMLPLAAGGVIVVAIFTFVPVWGEYLMAYTFTNHTGTLPMSVAIRFFEPSPATGKYTVNVGAAAALYMFVPAIVIYVVLQRWFTKGLLEGGLKL